MGLFGIAADILAILSAAGTFLIFLYLTLTHKKAPRFSKSINEIKNTNQHPFVSVIITARNEEDKISACIDSLSRQTYRGLEIIVVDDASIDQTPKIVLKKSIEDPRIRLVEAGERQEGWVGKSWPCWRGFESAKGEFLLFVDADSQFEPSIIEASVNYLISKSYDMLSISPKVKMKGVWASATLPLVSGAIDLLYPMMKVNDPKNPRAYVFGTYILVRKSTYEAIDGHRGVRSVIVEDAALAQLAKSKGYSLRIEIGTEFLSTDWEHEGSKIYSGLERITSTSIRENGLVSTLNTLLLFFIALYPILLIIVFVFDPKSYLVAGAIASLLDIVLFMTIFGMESKLVARRIGVLPFLYPLGIVIFMSAIITTTLKVAKGEGIEWKGRSYTQPISSESN